MKLTNYLILEAYNKRHWLEAARLVCGEPHLELFEWQIRLYRHLRNLSEVIVDHGNTRWRWSPMGGVKIEDSLGYHALPLLTIFTT